MSNIDFEMPLEAVNINSGKIVVALVDWKRSPDRDGDYWLSLCGEVGSYCAGIDDNRISPIAEGWIIRNLELIQPATDRLERLEAFVAKLAEQGHGEARRLVAEIESVVDRDVVIARSIFADALEAGEWHDPAHGNKTANQMRKGEADQSGLIKRVVEALRRARDEGNAK